jgi:flagellar hook protein FlgE
MGFSQALSGLNASSGNLNVISNNIANSQTVGFKSSTTRFADIYAAGSRVGMGVKTAGVVQNFTNGTPETTNRALDLAISGTGFFTFQQNGQTVYSRNGQLTLTPDGYLENSQGAQLVGVSGAPVQIPSAAMAASATTAVGATLNLNAKVGTVSWNSAATSTTTGSSPTTTTYASSLDPADPSTYSYANTATIYDSLGNSHTLTMYFIKSGTNQWQVQTGLDGTLSTTQTTDPMTGDITIAPTVQQLDFDTSGLLTAGAKNSFEFPMFNGANDINFTLNLTGTTQFGNAFEMTTLTQSGYTSGSLVGFTIDENGNVIGNYSNDQTRNLAQIQLANFRSPEGLQPIGDNAWTATTASGLPLLGTAGVGQFGSIQTGMTESSNVDLTKELVNLIVAQRTFQANSQSVKAQSEVLQQAVNLGN